MIERPDPLTPAVVENMLAKIGRVIGLDVSRNKQLLARELSSEAGVSPELLAAKGSSKPKLQDVSAAEIYGQTQIKVAGRVVATTPKFASNTISDASAWYREQFNQLAGMIDRTLPLEAQTSRRKNCSKNLWKGPWQPCTTRR